MTTFTTPSSATASVTIATGQPRVVLGPLTTTFTPPGGCLIDAYVPAFYTAATTAFLGQICGPTDEVDNPSCWPPRPTSVFTPLPLDGWGFYSPGLICPVGHTTACSATGGGSSGWPIQFSIYGGETAYGCCPTGYICDVNWPKDRAYQTCSAVATSGQSVQIASCVSGDFGAASNTRLALPSLTIYAPLIEIRHQASDLPATLTTDQFQPATATLTASSLTSSEPPSSTSPSNPGLSTGAKAGIGVAVPIVVIATGVIVGLLFYRRKRRGDQATSTRLPMQESQNATTHFPQAKVSDISSAQEPREAQSDLPISYGPQEPLESSARSYGPQEPVRGR